MAGNGHERIVAGKPYAAWSTKNPARYFISIHTTEEIQCRI